jgi:hypothetical protein
MKPVTGAHTPQFAAPQSRVAYVAYVAYVEYGVTSGRLRPHLQRNPPGFRTRRRAVHTMDRTGRSLPILRDWLRNSGSWAKIGNNLNSQQCSQEIRRRLFDII